MRVKISDYIAKWFADHGFEYNFTVPGGGAMHLNMSLGHQEGIKNIFVQHEQAAALAAEGYYRKKGKLPLVCVTTGPGGSNAFTGVLCSWLDSIPMFVLSGQVKWSMTVRSTMLPMRTYGDQEYDIVKAAEPMTKYAVMVTVPETIKYHLEKALFLATHGRPGPVWVDVPLNIQWGYVDTDKLIDFDPVELENTLPRKTSLATYNEIIERIKKAERPVIYSGVELRTNGAYDSFLKLINKLNVPVVTSFDSIDILEEDHPLYVGRAGDVANRYGNWAVQNSDLLLVIGNRLGIRAVSYAVETWARAAYVIMVYPDGLEITKPNVHVELPIRADLKEFCDGLSNLLDKPLERKEKWFEICANWKKKYPVIDYKRHYADGDLANTYCFVNELSNNLPENSTVVSGNGSACVVCGSALLLKKGSRFIINSGCATMGYDLPAAIGASFATEKGPIYCVTGDGSIQMNLQELQTIVYHKLPIKIFVINNQGYHSMRQTENNLFPGMSHVGVGPESNDLSFPEMSKIAAAYDIPYTSIHSNKDMGAKIKEFLDSNDSYCMCEIFVTTEQVFEPKPTAKKLPDGTLVSPALEDLAPFLDRDELRDLMVIPLVGEEKK